jgi:hypothetical protein
MASAMFSTKTDFPLTWYVSQPGPPQIIEGNYPHSVPEPCPIRAYYVRPETNQTYCLDRLFQLFIDEGGYFPSVAKMKEVVEQLHPVDDLTLDELFMIFDWYNQIGRTSEYQHPFVLTQRKDVYSNKICGVIHVNGLIHYAQFNGGVASLKKQLIGSPSFPTWIGTVKYTPTISTPPWAFMYILDLDVFGNWLKQYLVFS